jgi:hypothetical protein
LIDFGDADISISALGYPDGTLIKSSGREIFLIQQQKKRMFMNFDSFKRMGFDISNVISIPDDELSEIPTGSPIV